jgi:hypothetical protein
MGISRHFRVSNLRWETVVSIILPNNWRCRKGLDHTRSHLGNYTAPATCGTLSARPLQRGEKETVFTVVNTGCTYANHR